MGRKRVFCFRSSRRTGCRPTGGPIAVMLEEHRIGRALVTRMAESVEVIRSGEDVAEGTARLVSASRDYVQMIRGHISKEDGVLFDMADLMIVGPACARLCEAYGTTCLGHLDGHTREELEALAGRLVEEYLAD